MIIVSYLDESDKEEEMEVTEDKTEKVKTNILPTAQLF